MSREGLSADEWDLAGLRVAQLPEDVRIFARFVQEADSPLKVIAVVNLTGGIVQVQMGYRVCSACWNGPETASDHVIAAWVFMCHLEKQSESFRPLELQWEEPEYVIWFNYTVATEDEPLENLLKRARESFLPVRDYLRQRAIVEDSWELGVAEMDALEREGSGEH